MVRFQLATDLLFTGALNASKGVKSGSYNRSPSSKVPIFGKEIADCPKN